VAKERRKTVQSIVTTVTHRHPPWGLDWQRPSSAPAGEHAEGSGRSRRRRPSELGVVSQEDKR
jgi:hypothetical protein